MDRRNIRVISPTVVDLTLERLLTRRVPTAIQTVGTVADDIVLLGEALTLSPSFVSVTGPSSLVQRVMSVPTEPIELERLREAGTQKISLEYDSDRLVCEPAVVDLIVRLSPKGRRVMSNVPPTILLDSDELVAQVFPATVTVTLEGPTTILDTLSSGDLSVLLNLTGRGESSNKLAPEVILPDGVELMEMSVDSLIVKISKGDRSGSR